MGTRQDATARYVATVVGPRRVGGVYRNAYSGVTYRVDAIHYGDEARQRLYVPSDVAITEVDLDGDTPGRERTHCTAWGRHDTIVSEPVTAHTIPESPTRTQPESNAGGTMSIALDLPAGDADPSTFASVARTLRSAEENARHSAARWSGWAESLRAEAAALGEKPDMADAAAELLAEAARADETADSRLGRASAYADKASEFEAKQVG